MIVAVIGSRSFNTEKDRNSLYEELDKLKITKIVSGGAPGADSFAKMYADDRRISIEVIRPDWSLGKHAGMLRNTLIVEKAQLVVAFWDGESSGTLDSIKKAKKMKKEVLVFVYPKNALNFDD